MGFVSFLCILTSVAAEGMGKQAKQLLAIFALVRDVTFTMYRFILKCVVVATCTVYMSCRYCMINAEKEEIVNVSFAKTLEVGNRSGLVLCVNVCGVVLLNLLDSLKDCEDIVVCCVPCCGLNSDYG